MPAPLAVRPQLCTIVISQLTEEGDLDIRSQMTDHKHDCACTYAKWVRNYAQIASFAFSQPVQSSSFALQSCVRKKVNEHTTANVSPSSCTSSCHLAPPFLTTNPLRHKTNLYDPSLVKTSQGIYIQLSYTPPTKSKRS